MKRIRSFASNGPKLYICSTPIGNLDDTSARLIDTLKSVDMIAAEDTRQTRKLLSRFEIHPKVLWSYHEHNTMQRAADLVAAWDAGQTVALVSDAGTPIISDPGEQAVALAIERDVPVIPIPGPSALLAALVASGMEALPFTFAGFLPRKPTEKIAALHKFGDLGWTFVLYESPYRVQKTVTEIAGLWPQRPVVLGRELTKRFETFTYGTASEVVASLEEEGPRGEYVIVIGPLSPSDLLQTQNGGSGSQENGQQAKLGLAEAITEVERQIAEGIRHKEAVKAVAKAYDVSRNELYAATLPEAGE